MYGLNRFRVIRLDGSVDESWSGDEAWIDRDLKEDYAFWVNRVHYIEVTYDGGKSWVPRWVNHEGNFERVFPERTDFSPLEDLEALF